MSSDKREIVTVLRNIVGGELKEYVAMMQQAREEVIDRMVEQAEDSRANTIVCVRFATCSDEKRRGNIRVYGTAVKVE